MALGESKYSYPANACRELCATFQSQFVVILADGWTSTSAQPGAGLADGTCHLARKSCRHVTWASQKASRFLPSFLRGQARFSAATSSPETVMNPFGRLALHVVCTLLLMNVECHRSGAGTPMALTVAGSTSVRPFAEKWAELNMQKHPGTQINLQGGGSTAGIRAARIGASSRALKPDGSALHAVVVARDGIAVSAPGGAGNQPDPICTQASGYPHADSADHRRRNRPAAGA